MVFSEQPHRLIKYGLFAISCCSIYRVTRSETLGALTILVPTHLSIIFNHPLQITTMSKPLSYCPFSSFIFCQYPIQQCIQPAGSSLLPFFFYCRSATLFQQQTMELPFTNPCCILKLKDLESYPLTSVSNGGVTRP